MSGIDISGLIGKELVDNEQRERRKAVAGDMVAVIAAIAVVLAMVFILCGCASICKRCNVRPAVTEYKPHGDQVSTAVCGECAVWMGRKIRRKAVR